MIFQYTVDKVLKRGNDEEKAKRQTRRTKKSQDRAVYDGNQIKAVKTNGRLKWAVGKTYAVQPGRTQPAVARIRITKIRHQIARSISEEDAIKEGFSDRQAFFDAWEEIHGKDSLDLHVWVLDFELVEKDDSMNRQNRIDAMEEDDGY